MFLRKIFSLSAFTSLVVLTSCTRLFQDEEAPPPPQMTKQGLISPAEGAPLKDSWAQAAGEGVYRVGKPYKVNGVWYFPKEDYSYDEVGYASWYGTDFHNKRTANGEIFDMHMLSGAHKTLPLPSVVRVTNLQNGRSLVLRVNDRGPFVNDRILDVSKKAAQLLGFKDQGTTKVRVELLPEESMTVASLAQKGGVAPIDQIKPAEAGEVVVTQEFAGIDSVEPSNENSAVGSDLPGGNLESQKQGEPLFDQDPLSSLSRKVTDEAPPVISEEEYNRQLEESLKGSLSAESLSVSSPTPSTKKMPHHPNSKGVLIQAGVFSRSENAKKASQALKVVGETHLQKIETSKGTSLFKVQVGPFDSPEEAKQALKQVKALGHSDALVIRG